MHLLLQDYLSERLQAYFDALQLTQTDKLLEHKFLIDALQIKGALQEEEAPEESNIFRWPWSLKGDESDPLFLKHCCLRFFYIYSGGKWENRQLYFTKDSQNRLSSIRYYLRRLLSVIYETYFADCSQSSPRNNRNNLGQTTEHSPRDKTHLKSFIMRLKLGLKPLFFPSNNKNG